MRVLSTSPRKCTVTGIDKHELPGLDVVQCATFVDTIHSIVNLIMNEYAYFGRGHSILSSGQIEWYSDIVDDKSVQVGGQYSNIVDDKSVQVGGQQRIVTIDIYSMPLV